MDREAVRQRLLLPQVFLPGHSRRCQDPRNNRRAITAAMQADMPRPRTVLAFRDQEAAMERLNSPGSGMLTVLASQHHSLFGYPADLQTRFDMSAGELGQGGNAVVRRVKCNLTGCEYACKSIKKVLEGSQWSQQKRDGHLSAIRQEVDSLRKLRGSLNVATLEDVYEDENQVHIIMELCRGGELVHRIGSQHYSERTVASYMRAVLRTIAQCHSHHILHRDIKPGNFLLLNDHELSPLKAIDFGLATPFDPDQLPRSDLGLEGTPWYMAPEVLSSQVGPASDVWSAGVMAFQLLTGRFPFDDRKNPLRPSVTKIWQCILGDQLDFGRSYWSGVSEEGRAFVGQLLERDPAKRPTAKQALQHPWLRGHAGERPTGKPLSLSVVQRIQRFGQGSLLRRTVLEHIAEDMLRHAQDEPSCSREPAATSTTCPITKGARPLLLDPTDAPLQFLYQSVNFGDLDLVSRQQLLASLQRLGYRLDARETGALMDQVDSGHTGSVAKVQLAASQMDWQALQQQRTQAWLQAAARAFAELDTDHDGVWSVQDIVACLRSKLAPSEVVAALQQALQEAHKREESLHETGGIDFDSFLMMLRADSRDSLDQYDDRMGSSADRLNLLLDSSCRAGEAYGSFSSTAAISEVF